MLNETIFREIEKLFARVRPEEKKQFISKLPKLFRVKEQKKVQDIAWLKLSDSSFDFWNNSDDAVYDSL